MNVKLTAILLMAVTAASCAEEERVAGPVVVDHGIWIEESRLRALPTSGPAWDALKDEAERDCGTPDLSDNDQRNNVCIMAKALVAARTNAEPYRAEVVSALETIVEAGEYEGRALALGRELAAYVIAADLIGLASYDPELNRRFKEKLRELLTAPTEDGPKSLVRCHELRPNNWGLHCGASRAAIAAYLGDQQELERVATVFRGWLGDRAAYAGFKYRDLWWQCNPQEPVGINPKGCTKNGHPIGGVLPDDQRRGGEFTWPPPKENYTWGALQGAVALAVILDRQGYDPWQWSDQALLRAVVWLHEQADFPAEDDETWVPHIINHFYGTNFPAPSPTEPGKNVGWADWTH
jgi:hypothetical protein